MASTYYNESNKTVYDGDTANAADLNAVNEAVDTGFQQVESDITTIGVASEAWGLLAEEWARNQPGDKPEDITPYYSALAYAFEAKEYAQAALDTPVELATGLASTDRSSYHWSLKAAASAAAALVSQDAALVSELAAAASAAAALVSEENALGAHTISDGGENIVITQVSLDYEVAHDTVGASALAKPTVDNKNICITQMLTDANGHIFSYNSVDNDLRYLGLTAKAADSDKLNGQLASYYATASGYMPKSGGTFTGTVSMDGNWLGMGGGHIYTNGGSIKYDITGTKAQLSLGTNWAAMYTGAGESLLLSTSQVIFNETALLSGGTGYQIHLNSVLKASFQAKSNGTVQVYNGVSNGGVFLTCLGMTSVGLQNFVGTDGFAPTVDGAVHLGDDTMRWASVWAVNGTIQTSDETLKDISDIGDCSWLYELTPISFRWKNDQSEVRYGFGAQDIYDKSPKKDTALVKQPKVKVDKDGKKLKKADGTDDMTDWGFAPDQLIAPMLQLIKEQKELIDNLTARVATLEAV